MPWRTEINSMIQNTTNPQGYDEVPQRFTEETQVKKIGESTGDRQEVLFEGQSKGIISFK